MNYKFDWLNNGLEIVNPDLEIVGLKGGNPSIHNINFITLKYHADIILTVKDAEGKITTKFGLRLENIQAESLNWESGQDLPEQVLTALNSQFSVPEV